MKTQPLHTAHSYYRGWSVMAGGFVCAMLAVGGTLYIFGLFVVPVAETFNLSRADVNNGMILNMLGMAMWSPLMGRLLDRYSAQKIMLFGALMYGAGMLLIATTQSPWIMCLAIVGPVAMSVTSAGALASNTITARWFHRRRGRALGILAISTSAGGFLMTPIFARLIEQYQWQNALLIVALAVPTMMIMAILCLIRDRPSEKDKRESNEFQMPDTAHLNDSAMQADTHAASRSATDSNIEPAGDAAANATVDTDSETADDTDPDEKSWAFAELARSRNFWLLSLGAGLLLASDAALIATKVPYMLDQGISLSKAAFLVSCMTASAICGKLIVGYLADKVDVRYLFGVVVACHVALLSTLVIMPDYWVLLAIVSFFGIAVGGVYPVWLSLTAIVFGAKSYGTVMGSMGIIMQPLSIVAIRFIGEMHDRTGSYAMGFAAFIASVLVAFILVMLVKLPRQSALAD